MYMSGAWMRGLKWRCKFGNGQYMPNEVTPKAMDTNKYLHGIFGEKEKRA